MDTTTCTLSWNQLIVEPLNKFFTDLAWFIPDLLTALCIVITGWVAGRLLQLLTSYFLGSVGFDGFAKKIGIAALLEDNEVKLPAHKWAGLLVFWLVIIMAIVRAMEKISLGVVAGQVGSVIYFAAKIFAVFMILIVGIFLSVIVGHIVRSVAEHVKFAKPQLYGNIAKFVVLLAAVLAALTQLNVAAHIFMIVAGGIFLVVCIASAIAFGVGGIPWAGKVLDRTIKK